VSDWWYGPQSWQHWKGPEHWSPGPKQFSAADNKKPFPGKILPGLDFSIKRITTRATIRIAAKLNLLEEK
jgi:hypothetical protein